MKTIKNLNSFAIGLPLAIIITYPIFKEGALFFALLSKWLRVLSNFVWDYGYSF